MTTTLAELNAATTEQFAATLSHIVEDSAWVAEAVARRRPFASRHDLQAAFCRELRTADRDRQLAVIRAHPDLAGSLDSVTSASRGEQERAGLAALAPRERERFRELNEGYRVKFGFPFIFAVKDATADAILASFEARMPNDMETEVAEALEQIERIIMYRLDDIVV